MVPRKGPTFLRGWITLSASRQATWLRSCDLYSCGTAPESNRISLNATPLDFCGYPLGSSALNLSRPIPSGYEGRFLRNFALKPQAVTR